MKSPVPELVKLFRITRVVLMIFFLKDLEEGYHRDDQTNLRLVLFNIKLFCFKIKKDALG